MSGPNKLATIIRVRIEEGKAGLFYATSPDLRGLLVGKPTIDELFDTIPKAIADLHEAAHDTRPIVIQAARGEDPMIHPWVILPQSPTEF
jgi:hypothetical protein